MGRDCPSSVTGKATALQKAETLHPHVPPAKMKEDEQVEGAGGRARGPWRCLLLYLGLCALKSADGHPGESLTTKDALSRKGGTLLTLTRPALHPKVCLQEPQGAARLSWSWRAYVEEETLDWLFLGGAERLKYPQWQKQRQAVEEKHALPGSGRRGQGTRFPQGPAGDQERPLSGMEPQDISQEGGGERQGRGGCGNAPCLDVGKQGTVFRQDRLPSLLWKPVYPGKATAPRPGGQMPAFLCPRPCLHFRESLS